MSEPLVEAEALLILAQDFLTERRRAFERADQARKVAEQEMDDATLLVVDAMHVVLWRRNEWQLRI